MIKVIAFDLIGVLAYEKDIALSAEEEKLERLFGPNLSDEDYLNSALKITDKDVITITKNIINKLYEIKDKDIFKKIKVVNSDIKLLIATNHVSLVREFIENSFEMVDDIIISSQIHKIKPNIDFYEYILDKYNINADELLFFDDNEENVQSAKSIGINAVKVQNNTDLLQKIVQEIK